MNYYLIYYEVWDKVHNRNIIEDIQLVRAKSFEEARHLIQSQYEDKSGEDRYSLSFQNKTID